MRLEPTVTLRPGRVQPVWAGHPWIFAQAIDRITGAPAPGSPVQVQDPRGNFLGRGFWSPNSAIPIRIISRDPEEALGPPALFRRIERAAQWRSELFGLPCTDDTGYRLVHAEGDDLPGLIVDIYDKTAVIQFLTIGMKQRQQLIVGALMQATDIRTVIEAPAGRSQEREGITVEPGVLRGPEVDALSFRAGAFEYQVHLGLNHKTGFYFDRREIRPLVEKLSLGRKVLDLYSYVGAFSLAAARGGAESVRAIDSSAVALTLGAEVARRNGFQSRIAFSRGDMRRTLPRLRKESTRYGLVLVDPPKFAPTTRHLNRAKNAYRKVNAGAMALVEPGGLMLSLSSSAALKTPDFLRTLALAARDVNRTATVLHVGQQAFDHPVPAAFSEGRYLKSALLRLQPCSL